MKRWSWVADALVVVAFAVIGREDHGDTSALSDYARVAAPFLIGLAVASVGLRTWQPLASRTGAAIALGTVAVGMLMRRLVWDDGIAFTFIVVTTAVLVAGMTGWRLVMGVVRRGRSRGSS